MGIYLKKGDTIKGDKIICNSRKVSGPHTFENKPPQNPTGCFKK